MRQSLPAEGPLLFITRFGHTATPLSDSVVLLTGGFGLYNGKHMRLNGVQLLRNVQGNFLTFLFLFFTVTKLLYLLNLFLVDLTNCVLGFILGKHCKKAATGFADVTVNRFAQRRHYARHELTKNI